MPRRGAAAELHTDELADPHPTIRRLANRVMTQLQQLAERVERLLLRHEELQRTNALLLQQVQSLNAERESLKSRLSAARTRIDHLIDKLPQQAVKMVEGGGQPADSPARTSP